MQLSAVIITKNEEGNIKRCIKGVSFCDEIIVIDDNSSDETTKIAKNLGAEVYQRSMGDSFSKQRNYALSKAGGKWILFVDADEVVSEGLRAEIIQAVNNPLTDFLPDCQFQLPFQLTRLLFFLLLPMLFHQRLTTSLYHLHNARLLILL